jgi:hypothetical protein
MGRRRFMATALAALAVLVLLGGIGAGVWIASSDEDGAPAAIAESPSRTDAPGPTAPAQEPPAAEAAPPGEPELEPTPAPEPAPPAASQPDRTTFPRERDRDPNRRGKRFSVPPAHEFTGSGNALIGTVDVRQPAIVKWRARGRFGLEFGQEAFPIVAPSRSGQLVVPPYRYEQVRVLATGPWTITVTPRGL